MMEVHSIQEYISLLEKLEKLYTFRTSNNVSVGWIPNFTYKPHFIYRGHGDYRYTILPGIFRSKNGPEGIEAYSLFEHNILQDFISETCRYEPKISENDIGAWLEIAQHFGVPTRLLDFTENPLVALYFACSDAITANATVCLINEPEYNRKFFGMYRAVQATESNYNVNRIITDEIISQDFAQHVGLGQYIQWPWIYKPHYREERMNMQQSVFMLWGADRRPLEQFMAPDDYIVDENVQNSACGVIGKIQIKHEDKEKILRQLALCGINEKYIYPGIDGIGRYINKKYLFKGNNM